jgi:hypothetical protein
MVASVLSTIDCFRQDEAFYATATIQKTLNQNNFGIKQQLNLISTNKSFDSDTTESDSSLNNSDFFLSNTSTISSNSSITKGNNNSSRSSEGNYSSFLASKSPLSIESILSETATKTSINRLKSPKMTNISRSPTTTNNKADIYQYYYQNGQITKVFLFILFLFNQTKIVSSHHFLKSI